MPDPRIFPIINVENYAAQVTDVSAIVVPANDKRVDLEIVNDLDTVVYLARGEPAVVGEGIKLISNGSYSMDTQNLYEGAFSAICNIGEDGGLAISEGERQWYTILMMTQPYSFS